VELKRVLTMFVYRTLAEWGGRWPCGECVGCRALAIAKAMSIANPTEIEAATREQRELIIATLKEIVRELGEIPELRFTPNGLGLN
jgi:hypothetical protein